MKKSVFSYLRIIKSTSARRVGLSVFLVPVILALLLGMVGCTHAGTTSTNAPSGDSGADAFRWYYTQKAAVDSEHDYSRMDLRSLEKMASDTVGTVVDSEELAIEVRGAIISGNTAEVILRVTAKQLDSVLRDDGKSVPKNYRFGDESFALTRKYNFDSLSFHYSYSDEEDSLASNQLELHYWIIQEPIELDHCSIELTNFGYYGPSGFVPVYTGSWTVEVPFVPASAMDKRIDVEQEFRIEDHKFELAYIRTSPLAFTIQMACKEDDAFIREHYGELFDAFLDGSRNCFLMLADGTKMDSGQFYIEYSSLDDFRFFIVCYGPIETSSVVSLSMFDTEFFLSSSE